MFMDRRSLLKLAGLAPLFSCAPRSPWAAEQVGDERRITRGDTLDQAREDLPIG
jgi:hypothetical protein